MGSIFAGGNPLHGLGQSDVEGSFADQVRSTRRLAVTGLVLSLLWVGGVFSLAAIAIGYGARRFLRHNDVVATYVRIADAAIVLGLVGVAAGIWIATDIVA